MSAISHMSEIPVEWQISFFLKKNRLYENEYVPPR